jgi:hypothetical protein
MNCTLSIPTDAEFNNYSLQTGMQLVEDTYATSPLITINPIFRQVDEEELHTSFEKAISDRLVALNGRLSRISDPSLSTSGVESITRPILQKALAVSPKEMPKKTRLPFFFTGRQQLGILLGCFALLCLLLGFDLMGLLVLFLH